MKTFVLDLLCLVKSKKMSYKMGIHRSIDLKFFFLLSRMIAVTCIDIEDLGRLSHVTLIKNDFEHQMSMI